LVRDPLATFVALQHEYGDALQVPVPLSRKHTFFLLNRPEHVEHVLVAHQDNYVKPFTYRPLKAFLGDGLLTAEGARWQRHRRLVQPVFSHRHIQSFGPAIVTAARERFGQWVPGSTIDIADEMRALTMDVIGRVLFGADLAGDAVPVGRAVTRLQSSTAIAAMLPVYLPEERLRTVAPRIVPGLGRALHTLESVTARIIDARIEAPHDEPSDLLDLLLVAGQDEEPLSRAEIHAEVMTLVCAGHETTANALTWALTLFVAVSRRSSAARRRGRGRAGRTRPTGIRHRSAAVDEGGDVRDAEALSACVAPRTRRGSGRRHLGDPVSAGDTVGISPYLLHRNPEFWCNPDEFDPRRFVDDGAGTRPRYAYLPFGGGRRICVGTGLAQMETTLALAVLAQSAHLKLEPTASLRMRADITLHPTGPVTARVTQR
jgi:cytochrome P450